MRAGLPGLADERSLVEFAEELATTQSDSDAFHSWASVARTSAVAPDLGDPSWDPCTAILSLNTDGDLEEATWLAFLSTHIGPGTADWTSLRAVYSDFGTTRLSWAEVTSNPGRLLDWYRVHGGQLGELHFTNHRKFESWRQFGDVALSYIRGIARTPDGTQAAFFSADRRSAGENFDRLIYELTFVYRFGRLAVYDFLSLLGDLGVYPLAPQKIYLEGSTGPLAGARRLYGSTAPAAELDAKAVDLASRLGVSLGTMEDALCNWQKHQH